MVAVVRRAVSARVGADAGVVRYLLTLVAIVVSACGPLGSPPGEDDSRRASLQQAVQASAPGDVIDLADVLGRDWDRVGVFGPYWTNDTVAKELATEFDYERATNWLYSEGGHVVVMASGDDVVAWFNIPLQTEIMCLDGKVLEQLAATVGVVESTGFGKVLGPVERPNCFRESAPLE